MLSCHGIGACHSQSPRGIYATMIATSVAISVASIIAIIIAIVVAIIVAIIVATPAKRANAGGRATGSSASMAERAGLPCASRAGDPLPGTPGPHASSSPVATTRRRRSSQDLCVDCPPGKHAALGAARCDSGPQGLPWQHCPAAGDQPAEQQLDAGPQPLQFTVGGRRPMSGQSYTEAKGCGGASGHDHPPISRKAVLQRLPGMMDLPPGPLSGQSDTGVKGCGGASSHDHPPISREAAPQRAAKGAKYLPGDMAIPCQSTVPGRGTPGPQGPDWPPDLGPGEAYRGRDPPSRAPLRHAQPAASAASLPRPCRPACQWTVASWIL